MKIDLKSWPLMRIIRLVIAIGCFYAFFINGSEWFILVAGMVVLLQVILNPGCSSGSCAIPEDPKSERIEN